MGLGTILIIILILLLIGALPTWGHSRSWGYFPSGGLGLVLVIIIILVLLGKVKPSHWNKPQTRLASARAIPGDAWRTKRQRRGPLDP